MTEKELLELKQEIEEAKQQIQTHKGKLEYLMGELKKTWGCSSVEQSETKLASLEKEGKKLTEQIGQKMEELETQLDENTGN